MQSLRPVFNTLSKQVRRYHGVQEYKPPHMNELPVPSGSWQRLHEERQRKYNSALILGITFFSVSLFCLRSSGVDFNRYVPESFE